MSMHAAGDIPLQITSENSSSERRITPSWTIGQLKAKLEPVTGIPPLSQKLTLRLGSQQSVPIEAVDEENTQLGGFPLAPYAEIHVSFESIDVRFAKHVVILCLLACSDSCILVYIAPRCAKPCNTTSSVFWKRLLTTFGLFSDAERVSGGGARLLFPVLLFLRWDEARYQDLTELRMQGLYICRACRLGPKGYFHIATCILCFSFRRQDGPSLYQPPKFMLRYYTANLTVWCADMSIL